MEVKLNKTDIVALTGHKLKEVKSWDWLELDKQGSIEGNEFFKAYVKNVGLKTPDKPVEADTDDLDAMDLEELNTLELQYRGSQSQIKFEQLNDRYRSVRHCGEALDEVKDYLIKVGDTIVDRFSNELPGLPKDELILPTASRIAKGVLNEKAK